MSKIYLILVLILLTSCGARRVVKTDSYREDHYEVSHIESERTDIRNAIETIMINGNRHIKIYDTSKAEYTDSGFVSPLLAEIEEIEETISVRDESDSARCSKIESDTICGTIVRETRKEKENVRVNSVCIAVIFLVICFLIRKLR